ncbi:MAG: hypothetical protein A3C71_01030 [Candidatus Yanofskybacteria bacterium RIFCSPHIGHO2_02_FULL_43_15c]|uniref:Uncharacterized protein n=1 Tax=Candidatus Yanofskybacteria bacterium RIFCSPHIGHO2_02_FULL_43_15c TaxID=1802679 RepID=A0A1F8FIC9_9BACT|nr:MAG: hypothetical protein A3C71_01030 [Candidatus Yanofskybacteria bacterium RIFCSPHIGHO2_02_FULL_43_15c]
MQNMKIIITIVGLTTLFIFFLSQSFSNFIFIPIFLLIGMGIGSLSITSGKIKTIISSILISILSINFAVFVASLIGILEKDCARWFMRTYFSHDILCKTGTQSIFLFLSFTLIPLGAFITLRLKKGIS